MDNEVEVRLKAFKDNELGAILEEKMKALCLKLEGEAKKNCPVDDGTLRASIASATEVNKDSVTGYLGSNCFYAPYVHQGTGIYAAEGDGRKTPWFYKDEDGTVYKTVGQKPNPFIQKAIDDNKELILNEFEGAV